jgi:hypothetical protein
MKKSTLAIVIVLFLIIIGGAYYYWTQTNKVQTIEPTVAEVKAVLTQLQKHMVLPTDEDPQIGRIDDPIEAAKVQPFVAGAQKGDLLIVYVKAHKAIVFSPARDLIINVGPVSVGSDQTEATPKTISPATSTTPAKR